ncbi:unnamed protein product, partial [Bubo scandiacus]
RPSTGNPPVLHMEKLRHRMCPRAQDESSVSQAPLQAIPLRLKAERKPLLDCLKDLTGRIEYAAKILNEIPQKDIQCTKRASKAEREGNGQARSRLEGGSLKVIFSAFPSWEVLHLYLPIACSFRPNKA